MRFGGRFAQGRFAEGRWASGRFSAVSAGVGFSASISGLTSNPTHGTSAQVDVELTGSISGLLGGEAVVNIWTLGGSVIGGATAAIYTPVAGQDLGVLRYAPTVDGVPVQSPAYTVRHAPPTATGAIADQVYVEGVAITPLDVAADFTGSGMSYALAPSSAALPAGLSLSGAALQTGTPTVPAAQVNIVVRGTNSGGFADTAFGATVDAVQITAAVTPSMTPLYDGQSVQDVVDYATKVAIGNFASNAGAISSAVPGFTGDAIAADDPLVEGESAGFTVTVEDAATNSVMFTATNITVQYKARILTTIGNEAEFDINPLVPDIEVLNLSISGATPAHYNGAYTPTAGDLRNNVWNFPGTLTIAGTTGLDDTLTGDDGLWTTPTGNLTLTYQWQSDDVDIPGATGASFNITASEQGTNVRRGVRGDDGVNPPIIAYSPPLAIPAASSPITVTQIGIIETSTTTATTPTNLPFDFGVGNPGDEALIEISYGIGASGTGVTCDLGGVAATPVTEQKQAIQANTGIFRKDVSAGGIQNLVMAPVGNGWRSYQIKVHKVSNHATIDGYSTGQNGVALMDLSQSMSIDDRAIGVISLAHHPASGAVVLDGLTRAGGVQNLNGSKEAYFVEATADATGIRTMTGDPDGGGSDAVSFALAVIR